jgi:predicted nucleotidyltransferase
MAFDAETVSEIGQVCKTHHVASLYVFGSVLTNAFHASSDVDFLVRFEGIPLSKYFDNYQSLKDQLQKIVERPVDLVEEQAVRNPVLQRSIEDSRLLIYG